MTTTTSTTPLVSIGIPTFDRPELLGLALRSALQQTYEHLEIFVADDGTNPDTEAVVREVADGDERVHYERNERNLGNYGNGIKVLQAARGEFQKMLLDDDLLAPTHVEQLLAALLDDPRCTMAFSKRTIIDVHGNALPDPPAMSAIAQVSGRIPAQDLINLCCSTTSNWIGEQTTVLYRASVVDQRLPVKFAGARPSAVMGDLAMHFGALARGDAWYTPEPLSSFRQHEGQFSNDPRIHMMAMSDWTMFFERLHLVSEPLPTADRLRIMARLIGVSAANLANTPDAEPADQVQDELERSTRHLRALRVHGNLIDVPRVSIVIVANGDAPDLLPQIESIIEHTPSDAFEVVIVTIEPTEQVQALLGALEGDIQIVSAERVEDAEGVGARHAQWDTVAHLAPGDRTHRGWIADLLDEQLIDEASGAEQ